MHFVQYDFRNSRSGFDCYVLAMAKDDQEKALIANGVEAEIIWSERLQEHNFWISIAYPDTRFLLSSRAPRFLCQSRVYISDQNDIQGASRKQNVNWRERLALQSIRNLITKEVIDVVTTSTADMGPLSLDSFRKGNLSASWKVIGVESSVEDNASSEMASVEDDYFAGLKDACSDVNDNNS
ncbi:alpha-1,4-galacturonosyltransferase 1-like protein [Corchorus olitorius]|uniref:Alpha-1,4-galacturonosyltransferase 1-like protein n=1 Tax=Corchorus olitorius TaxID=93759 RepID=A0A1R3K061_9ROSI|nr:alpha-1,4-galacturonosyltransferase 1-like protein [Corchorus olitorius]